MFLPTKNNLGPDGGGIGFRIGQVDTPSGILAPTIFWDAMPVTMSAEEVLGSAADHGSAPARSEAEDFLREVLADGSVPTDAIKDEARKAGLAWRTVRRAKDRLGVAARKSGTAGEWVWTLPQDGHG